MDSVPPAPAGTQHRKVPATVAGLLAALPEVHPGGRADSTADRSSDRVAVDLDLLCARPIHHYLEYAGLYGLLEALQAAAPARRVRVWVRSALGDDSPFLGLPAAVVARLPEAAEEGPAGAVLASLRRGGSVCVLLGRDAEWEARLDSLPGWCRAEPASDFQWRLPDGRSARAAAGAFFHAISTASPRWVVARDLAAAAAPAPAPSRLLIHQARSHIGDALWLTPLLRAVRRRFPGATITVLAAPAAAPVLAANPNVTEILTLAPDTPPAARRELRRRLACQRFDAALLAFARRPQALWLAEAVVEAGIAWRVNQEYFDRAGDGREPSALFTHEAWFFWGTLPSPRLLVHALDPLPCPGTTAMPNPAAGEAAPTLGTAAPGHLPAEGARVTRTRHAGAIAWHGFRGQGPEPRSRATVAGRSASHAATLGDRQPEDDTLLDLPIPAAWHAKADQALRAAGIAGRPFALLAPAARSSARWPARKFASLALCLAEALGLSVLIEGGSSPGDTAVLAEVHAWLHWFQEPGSQRPARRRLLAAHPAYGLLQGLTARPRPATDERGEGIPPTLEPPQILVRHDPLGTLAALLARARLLVANDSAPIHLAGITGTPTLYLAHHEKLVHSHPAGSRCRALYDAARNRPARIPVSAALAAIAEMVRDGLVRP